MARTIEELYILVDSAVTELLTDNALRYMDFFNSTNANVSISRMTFDLVDSDGGLVARISCNKPCGNPTELDG